MVVQYWEGDMYLRKHSKGSDARNEYKPQLIWTSFVFIWYISNRID